MTSNPPGQTSDPPLLGGEPRAPHQPPPLTTTRGQTPLEQQIGNNASLDLPQHLTCPYPNCPHATGPTRATHWDLQSFRKHHRRNHTSSLHDRNFVAPSEWWERFNLQRCEHCSAPFRPSGYKRHILSCPHHTPVAAAATAATAASTPTASSPPPSPGEATSPSIPPTLPLPPTSPTLSPSATPFTPRPPNTIRFGQFDAPAIYHQSVINFDSAHSTLSYAANTPHPLTNQPTSRLGLSPETMLILGPDQFLVTPHSRSPPSTRSSE